MRRRSFLQAAAGAAVVQAAPRRLSADQLTAGTACLAGRDIFQALDELHRMGFSGVEVLNFTGASHSQGLLPGAVVSEMNPGDRAKLLRSLARFRVVTTHLPFHGLYVASADPAKRQAAQRKVLSAVDDSAQMRATIGTAHALPEPGQTPEQARGELIGFFRRLGDRAAKHGMRIGVETGWPNTVAGFLDLIRAIDHPHVGATVDTGHTRSYRQDIGVTDSQRNTPEGVRRYNDVLLQLVNGLGGKLFHFHADDVSRDEWRDHRVPGTGVVDWARLLKRLAELGYTGTLALELEEPDIRGSLLESMKIFRKALA